MSIYTLSQVLELAKSHGSEYSNGAWVLLSLVHIHSPYLSNSDKVAAFENLLFFAQRCIGAGCEPRVRPLPGQDGQGVSLAAPAEADQVEGTPTPTPTPCPTPFSAFRSYLNLKRDSFEDLPCMTGKVLAIDCALHELDLFELDRFGYSG